jgi:hypothetical protein
MLPSERLITQQYHKKGFIVYDTLGTAPLHEVHVIQKTRRDGSSNHPKNSSGCMWKKNRKPRRDFNKEKTFLGPNTTTTRLFLKCDYCNQVAKKYKIPKYLVELYMMSMGYR